MRLNITDKISHALKMSKEWHSGQVRKYTGEPYYLHTVEVMEIVKTVPHIEEMLCAALLHDVVEDTDCTLDMINNTLGDEVAYLVEMLTDVSKPEDGNRSKRKAIDLEHTSKASPMAKTIKLADLISNTKSIVKHDKNFAKVYLQEKALLLEVLKDGDETLWNIANVMLISSMEEIK